MSDYQWASNSIHPCPKNSTSLKSSWKEIKGQPGAEVNPRKTISLTKLLQPSPLQKILVLLPYPASTLKYQVMIESILHWKKQEILKRQNKSSLLENQELQMKMNLPRKPMSKEKRKNQIKERQLQQKSQLKKPKKLRKHLLSKNMWRSSLQKVLKSVNLVLQNQKLKIQTSQGEIEIRKKLI